MTGTRFVAFILIIAAAMAVTTCGRGGRRGQENPDSVKAIIMGIQYRMTELSATPSVQRAAQYAALCEDSVLSAYEGAFSTTSAALVADLADGISVPPHDFTFRYFGETAVLSFRETFFEVINGDTVYHPVRVLKTFVQDSSRWKMASISNSPEPFRHLIPGPPPRRGYAELEGLYQWSPNRFDTVFVRGGKLYDAMTGEQPELNIPINDSTFGTEHEFGSIVFGRDATGKISHYTFVRHDGQRFRIPRVQ